MYKLTKGIIQKDINYFTRSYDDSSGNIGIVFGGEYRPETFTVEEKKNCVEKIYFNEIDYHIWIEEIILDVIKEFKNKFDEKETIKWCSKNIGILLDTFKHLGIIIYNQEFVDVVRAVLAYTLFGDFNHQIESAKSFNSLVDMIMPFLLDKIDKAKLGIESLLSLSILCGMCGLDLKGSPSAASKYSNEGIAMRKYYNYTANSAAEELFLLLINKLNALEYGVFDYREFEEKLENGGKIVWLTDDYLESHLDLILIKRILAMYRNVSIDIIPKNGEYGNDLSYNQLITIMNYPIFNELNQYIDQERLKIVKEGPKLGCVNILKISSAMRKSFINADFAIIKGCRQHEMLQGYMKLPSFTSYVVTRKLSECVSGMNSAKAPVLFFHLRAGEFAFFRFGSLDDTKNEEVVLIDSLKNHIRRRKMNDVNDLLNEFDTLKSIAKGNTKKNRPIYQEMDLISEKLIDITRETYNAKCNDYTAIGRNELNELDKENWRILEEYISRFCDHGAEGVKILDIATGSGRDLIYGTKCGYKMMGLDNSEGFISILKQLEIDRQIPEKSFVKCDMRQLPFEDNSFDVVRHNASLVHMPIIDEGYTADLVLSESYRVLRKGGLLYVLVKKGEGVNVLDTNEGLGGRVFQFYSKATLLEILERNKFKILSLELEYEKRGNDVIEWVMAMAQK